MPQVEDPMRIIKAEDGTPMPEEQLVKGGERFREKLISFTGWGNKLHSRKCVPPAFKGCAPLIAAEMRMKPQAHG